MANERTTVRKRWLSLDGKTKDVLLIALLALVIVFAAWTVFSSKDQEVAEVSVTATETERKVSKILSEIEGVGEASVIICETEEGVQSVVVVCEGAKDLQVIMNVREAVSAALGTEEKSVKIYLKKE